MWRRETPLCVERDWGVSCHHLLVDELRWILTDCILLLEQDKRCSTANCMSGGGTLSDDLRTARSRDVHVELSNEERYSWVVDDVEVNMNWSYRSGMGNLRRRACDSLSCWVWPFSANWYQIFSAGFPSVLFVSMQYYTSCSQWKGH